MGLRLAWATGWDLASNRINLTGHCPCVTPCPIGSLFPFLRKGNSHRVGGWGGGN